MTLAKLIGLAHLIRWRRAAASTAAGRPTLELHELGGHNREPWVHTPPYAASRANVRACIPIARAGCINVSLGPRHSPSPGEQQMHEGHCEFRRPRRILQWSGRQMEDRALKLTWPLPTVSK